MDDFLASILPGWNDDRLIGVHFSPLPEPGDPVREQRVKFWEGGICGLLKKNRTISFTLQFLEDMFQRRGLIPKCLKQIDLLASGRVVWLNDINVSNTGQWLLSALVVSPSWWLYEKVIGKESAISPQSVFVYLPKLEELSTQMRFQSGAKDVASTAGDVLLLLSEVELPLAKHDVAQYNLSVQLVARHLVAKGEAVLVDAGNGVMGLKLATIARQKPKSVTNIDKGILRLRSTLVMLRAQEAKLSAERDQTNTNLLSAIAAKKKSIAALHLKKRKMLDDYLLKRISSANTIEEILLRIDSAETDARILEAYRLGKKLIEEKAKQTGVTVDAVDEAMSNLQSVLADQAEIDSVLTGLGQLSVDEEDELSRELEQLVLASQPIIPSVPVSTATLIQPASTTGMYPQFAPSYTSPSYSATTVPFGSSRPTSSPQTTSPSTSGSFTPSSMAPIRPPPTVPSYSGPVVTGGVVRVPNLRRESEQDAQPHSPSRETSEKKRTAVSM